MHIGFHKTFCKRLWLGLSHLRFHKLKHSFEGTLNPVCNCGTVETTVQYLFHCSNFSNERMTFFNRLYGSGGNILSIDSSNISKLLLYGDHSFNGKKNTSILTASTEYKYVLMLSYFKIHTSTCLCVRNCQEITC